MKLEQLIEDITIPIYLCNEEKELLKKLHRGVPKNKLSLREQEVILNSLKLKGLWNG